MGIKDKYESNLHKIALSCDAFTTAYLVLCLLLFVPYSVVYGGELVMWFLPIACLIPFVTMPLFYMLVHRVDMLLFGRYHLVMPVSAFVAALFFVIAFSSEASNAAGACLIFFGSAVFSTAVLLYRYCAFSVRVRLGGDGIASRSRYTAVFSAVGGIAAIATFFGFLYYDHTTAYLNTAYVTAGMGIVLALVQYLATYYGIPRLGGKRVQSVKNIFRAFYSGLNKRMYFSALMFTAAFCVIAALTVYFGLGLGLGIYTAMGGAAALIGGFAVCEYVSARLVKRRSMRLSVINLLCFVCSAAVMCVLSAVKLDREIAVTLFIAAAVLDGIGGAVAARQTKLRFMTVKNRATSGMIFIISELTAMAAGAIAVVIAATVDTVASASGSVAAFAYGFGAAAVFAVIAFILASKKSARGDAEIKHSYELHTAEVDAVQQPQSCGNSTLIGADSAKDKESL